MEMYFFGSKVAESFVDVDEIGAGVGFLAHSFGGHFLGRRRHAVVALQRRHAAARPRQVGVALGVTQLSTEIFQQFGNADVLGDVDQLQTKPIIQTLFHLVKTNK